MSRLASTALAAGVLVGAFAAAGCRDRSRGVVHLPISGTGWIEVGAETRPGRWLLSGDSVRWEIPPGLPLRISGAYSAAASGAPTGRLEVRVSGAAAVPVPLGGDARRWSSWSARLPALASPGRLEVTYRAEPSGAVPRAIFFSEPSLSLPRRPVPKTMVLVVIDTLRADRVSGYGYARPTTPRIDRYFGGGLRARAWPAADWTLPSHAALLTSTSIARNGVGRPGRILLPEDLDTLAAAFQRAGYRTLAVTGGGYVDPAFGFRRGFDRFAVEYGPASRAVETARAMLRDASDEPVFLFLHTYQLHDYAPDEAAARALFPDLSALGPDWRGNISEVRARFRSDPSVVAWARARYDAALRSVDDAFGRLLDDLETEGRLDRAAVLLTSDHGENLCDRDVDGGCLSWGHGTPYLFEEEVAVPLELRIPGRFRAAGDAGADASLLDAGPTLLEAAGLAAPTSFEGRSLFARAPAAGERAVVTEAPPLDAVAVRLGREKLIRRTGAVQAFRRPPRFHIEGSWLTGRPFAVLPVEECFDLARDPSESHPIPCDSDSGARLRDAADRYVASGFPGSLVVRIPPRGAGSGAPEVVLRVRGLGGPPAVRSFGLAAPPAVASRGAVVEARFSAGRAPVWLAFEPADRTGAIEIETSGLGPLAAASGATLPAGAYAWRELDWTAGRSLPSGVAVFTTPGFPGWSGTSGPLPDDLVARLRALGYLNAGSASAEPTPAGQPAPERETGPPLAPGRVVIRYAS